MKVDIEKFKQYQKDGWLKSQTHPELPLIIWNYTPNTQYEGKWDDVTMLARGLVTDTKGNVIAHPFKKFFNYSELKAWNKVPKGPFKVYEKLDGSYIQVFYYGGEWIVSSKGSFTSDQVLFAEGILENHTFLDYDEKYNHIFELIHPNNRIVVDYGLRKSLVLLGRVAKDGSEGSIEDQHEIFTIPKYYSLGTNFDQMRDFISDDEEGYVVKFNSGERMKIKGEEYLRLHRIVTHTSSKDIWIALKEDKDLQELIDRTPDEWTTWVYRTIGELYVKRKAISQQIQKDWQYGVNKHYYYDHVNKEWVHSVSRKDVALYFNSCQYPGLLFNYFDGNSNCDKLWDMVKPNWEKGFSI